MDSVRSVERALDILLSFIETPSMGISKIEAAVPLSRPTLYRLLNTLEKKGLLRSFGDPRTYQLTHRAVDLANAFLSATDFVRVTQPFLEELWETSSETVSLFVFQGDNRRECVQELRSKNPLSYAPGISVRPLHVGAPGKAILAFLQETAIDEILQVLPQQQAREELKAALRTIRRKMYCISLGELIAGGASIAAPIFDSEEKVVGSLALAMPQARLTKTLQNHYVELVLSTAARVSSVLGSTKMFANLQGNTQ
ncbi:IclR family transcriptional regulator [Cupriavidus basilensis]|nr:IclR family transcriptional regulator [Cupriavidus basilensis]